MANVKYPKCKKCGHVTEYQFDMRESYLECTGCGAKFTHTAVFNGIYGYNAIIVSEIVDQPEVAATTEMK